MDSEKRNGNPAEHNGNDNRHYHRPKRRRLRWGRLFLLLVVLAVLLTSVFWGSVWVYTNIIHAPEKKVVGEFEIDSILEGSPDVIWEQTKRESGITKEFYDTY